MLITFPPLLLQQRPTAKELLQHRFVKYARKTDQLVDLIDKYQEWRSKTPRKEGGGAKAKATEGGTVVGGGTILTQWEFETLKAGVASGLGGGEEEVALMQDDGNYRSLNNLRQVRLFFSPRPLFWPPWGQTTD